MLAFQETFDKIEKTVDYDPIWNNGTEYLDGAVKHVKLASGEMAKAVDGFKRRVILVGTVFGTCVAFERFSPKDDQRSNAIVSNVPRPCRALVRDGRMDEDTFVHNFQYETSNVGTKIDMILNHVFE